MNIKELIVRLRIKEDNHESEKKNGQRSYESKLTLLKMGCGPTTRIESALEMTQKVNLVVQRKLKESSRENALLQQTWTTCQELSKIQELKCPSKHYGG